MVQTNIVFETAKAEYSRMMGEWLLWDEYLLTKLNDNDIANVKKCGGFAKECFPNALIQTYLEYTQRFGQAESARRLDQLCSLGWDLLYEKPALMEGAAALLEKLSASHQLLLMTKGDHDLQEHKVKESGLADYFKKIYITREKNCSDYQAVVDAHNLSSRQSWSVGNSIKADINPALRVGLQCIHLQSPTWDYEHETPLGDYYAAADLYGVGQIICREANQGETGYVMG